MFKRAQACDDSKGFVNPRRINVITMHVEMTVRNATPPVPYHFVYGRDVVSTSRQKSRPRALTGANIKDILVSAKGKSVERKRIFNWPLVRCTGIECLQPVFHMQDMPDERA